MVYAIAPSRRADGDLWVGTDDGLVWRTRDGGEHWQDVTPEGLTAWSKVGILETSHFDAETAYAAVDRHRLDDVRPYVYRTHDGGEHWQLVAAGIPEGSFVNAVREDPVRRGLLYAGTERGVYVSFDDGDHWQPLQLDLPVTSVRDLDVNGVDLVIATHGRGIWILDDVTPLRQQGEVPADASAWLFQPAEAVRLRPAGFTGTPKPHDEAAAPNPPAGAIVDYWLKTGASGPVTLEVLDGEGALVRRYSSADPVPAPDPATLRTAPDWFRSPSTLSAEAGAHRFVWPLHYARPPALAAASRGFRRADGVWAPPGDYRLVLTVDGRRFEQPLTVVPDPRVELPPEAYREQLTLARQIEALQARVAGFRAPGWASSPRTSPRGGRRAPAEARADLDAVLERLAAISGIEAPADPASLWWLPPTSAESLRYADGALGDLAQAVDGADAAPSADARTGYGKLAALIDALARRWEEVETHDLPALDAK